MIDLATTQRETLTVPEVRTIFQKSERTIYYWLSSGKLVIVRTGVGCGARVSTESVRKLARAIFGHVPCTTCTQTGHSPQSSAKAS